MFSPARLCSLLCLLMACSGPSRAPSGASCPQGSTLDYDNFGRDFMETYCTRCHSSELRGADRQGAPIFHDFDTLEGIVVVADHVDEYTAAGPESVNEIMPPNGARPSLAERTQLGEWLACELDRINNPGERDAGAIDAAVDAPP